MYKTLNKKYKSWLVESKRKRICNFVCAAANKSKKAGKSSIKKLKFPLNQQNCMFILILLRRLPNNFKRDPVNIYN